jgi:hypothetical protein
VSFLAARLDLAVGTRVTTGTKKGKSWNGHAARLETAHDLVTHRRHTNREREREREPASLPRIRGRRWITSILLLLLLLFALGLLAPTRIF